MFYLTVTLKNTEHLANTVRPTCTYKDIFTVQSIDAVFCSSSEPPPPSTTRTKHSASLWMPRDLFEQIIQSFSRWPTIIVIFIHLLWRSRGYTVLLCVSVCRSIYLSIRLSVAFFSEIFHCRCLNFNTPFNKVCHILGYFFFKLNANFLFNVNFFLFCIFTSQR